MKTTLSTLSLALAIILLPAVFSQRQSKAGIAYAWGACTDPATLNLTERGGWWHRWSPEIGCLPAEGFVPLWRPGDSWPQGATYNGYALFLNEPDRPDQDNKTPAQAAVLWLQFRQLCPNCRAIVLNVSRCDNTTYVSQWREAVKVLTGSYPAVTGYGCHSYGSRQQILAQVEVVKTWLANTGQAGKQLWISEFGKTYVFGGAQLSASDLQIVINAFEHDPAVTRYAIYPSRYCNLGSCSDALFTGSSTTQLTAQGIVYRDGASAYPGPVEE